MLFHNLCDHILIWKVTHLLFVVALQRKTTGFWHILMKEGCEQGIVKHPHIVMIDSFSENNLYILLVIENLIFMLNNKERNRNVFSLLETFLIGYLKFNVFEHL